MGKINAKIYVILTALLSTLLYVNASAQQNLSGGSVSGMRLPEYDKESGNLKFVLYGDSAEMEGASISLKNVILDIIKKNTESIKDVKNCSRIKIYSIHDKRKKIEKFWKNLKHCEGLIVTPSAVFDRSTGVISGSEEIHVRSRIIDIDGVGFSASENSRKIEVLDDVKVVIRMHQQSKTGEDDKEKLKNKEINKEKIKTKK